MNRQNTPKSFRSQGQGRRATGVSECITAVRLNSNEVVFVDGGFRRLYAVDICVELVGERVRQQTSLAMVTLSGRLGVEN